MTLSSVSSSLLSLSVNNTIGNIRWTRKSFTEALARAFAHPAAVGVTYEISLPDGDWFCEVYKTGPHHYDYYIPETRDQEARVFYDACKERRA